MQLKRVGSQPSIPGPAEWFTGTVRIGVSDEQYRVGTGKKA